MMLAIALSALAGMAIGFRFKVFMVVPGIVAAAFAIAAISMVQGNAIGAAVAQAGLTAIAIQVGFICGSFAFAMKEAPVGETAPVMPMRVDAFQVRARETI